MATTTTNFGWDIPQSTDLVKDGATAIAALGQDIDTALVDLKGGTSGQVLAKASGTDLDFSWVAPAASGGMTLLSTTTLTGASTTISSISQSYKALLVYIYGVTNATADNSFFVHPNSVTNTAYTTGTINGTANNSAASNGIPLYWNGNPDRTSSNNASTLWIYNYASSTNYKNHTVNSVYEKSGSVIEYNSFGGGLITNTAITALKFISSGGSLSSGTVLIYGVN